MPEMGTDAAAAVRVPVVEDDLGIRPVTGAAEAAPEPPRTPGNRPMPSINSAPAALDLPKLPVSETTSGSEGNERLTATVGTVLLILLAAQGVTILSISALLTWHFFIGLLLIGPVCLKLGSVGHRFVQYHRGAPAYRRVGPPHPLLRLLGPLVAATTVAVLATGCTLALAGRSTVGPVPVLLLHKASFVCWATVTSLHVLAHLSRLPRLISTDLRRHSARHGAQRLPGRTARWSLVALALTAGTAFALVGAPLAVRWGR